MNLIIRLLLNAIAVFILAEILNGVQVDGYQTAIIVAIVAAALVYVAIEVYPPSSDVGEYYYY